MAEEESEVILFSRGNLNVDESVVLVGNSQTAHRIPSEDVGQDVPTSDYKSSDGEEDSLDPEKKSIYEYDQALRQIGFGPVHVLILFGTGLALAADSIEVLSVSYILEEVKGPNELDVNDTQRLALSCIIFLGMMVGGYVWGSLSDISGRRRALLMSLTLNGAGGLLSSLWRNFYFFLFLRFVSGIGVGGSLPIVASYCAEFVDSKKRAKFLGVLAAFWIFGQIFAAGLAWIIIPHVEINSDFLHSWQIFTMMAALPALTAACVYLVLPESPKFYLQVGKHEKALANLRKVHRINRLLMCKPKEECPVKGLKCNKRPEDDLALPSLMLHGIFRFCPAKVKNVVWRTRLLFKMTLLRRTLLFLSVYFCISFGSYGITVWFPTYIEHLRQSLNETTPNSTASDKSVLYTETFIYAAASFPGVAITAIVVDLPYMTRALWLCEF
jgi:VNT family MFS transporter (synaptic vesicle glycoprotein 2)